MNLDLCIIDSFSGSGPNYTRSTLLTCVADKTHYEFPYSSQSQRNLEKQQNQCFEYSGGLQVNRRCSIKQEMKVSGRGTCTLLPSSTHIQGWFLTASVITDSNQTHPPPPPYGPETRREDLNRPALYTEEASLLHQPYLNFLFLHHACAEAFTLP